MIIVFMELLYEINIINIENLLCCLLAILHRFLCSSAFCCLSGFSSALAGATSRLSHKLMCGNELGIFMPASRLMILCSFAFSCWLSHEKDEIMSCLSQKMGGLWS